MNGISMTINAAIFAVTLVLAVLMFYRKGEWSLANGMKALRFFTVQSNMLCGFAALMMCVAPFARWAWLLKYVGTAAVTVTMLTVFAFLGPTQGYGKMLAGYDFFMHLVTPLLALISFCGLEKRGMGFGEALWGMAPMALYGALYLYMIIYAPEDRRWKDFYGFNRGGKWPIAFGAMMVGGFAVCMGLMAIQNA